MAEESSEAATVRAFLFDRVSGWTTVDNSGRIGVDSSYVVTNMWCYVHTEVDCTDELSVFFSSPVEAGPSTMAYILHPSTLRSCIKIEKKEEDLLVTADQFPDANKKRSIARKTVFPAQKPFYMRQDRRLTVLRKQQRNPFQFSGQEIGTMTPFL